MSVHMLSSPSKSLFISGRPQVSRRNSLKWEALPHCLPCEYCVCAALSSCDLERSIVLTLRTRTPSVGLPTPNPVSQPGIGAIVPSVPVDELDTLNTAEPKNMDDLKATYEITAEFPDGKTPGVGFVITKGVTISLKKWAPRLPDLSRSVSAG